MKYKTYKLAKLENNRFSLLTDDLEHCFIHKDRIADDINEIFMGRNRQNSMKTGLCIPLCRECHEKYHIDRDMQLYFMQLALKEFLKNNSIQDFKHIFKYIKGLDIF